MGALNALSNGQLYVVWVWILKFVVVGWGVWGAVVDTVVHFRLFHFLDDGCNIGDQAGNILGCCFPNSVQINVKVVVN